MSSDTNLPYKALYSLKNMEKRPDNINENRRFMVTNLMLKLSLMQYKLEQTISNRLSFLLYYFIFLKYYNIILLLKSWH